jgi:hypothetical protein
MQFGPLEEEEQVDAFVDLLWEVAQLGDPAAMKVLLGRLDDGCPFAGIMGEVVQAIETQPDWIPQFTRTLPQVNEASPMWAKSIVISCLNTPELHDEMVQAASAAPENARYVLLEILAQIADEGGRPCESARTVASSIREGAG